MFSALLIAFMLVGCSSRPDQDVLRPQSVEEPAGARVVQVNVVTTRAPEAEAPWAYGANRAARPHYSAYAISIPPGHESGIRDRMAFKRSCGRSGDGFCNPEAAGSEPEQFPVEDGARWRGGLCPRLQHQLSGGAAAQLATDAHLEGTPVLFSWPSQAHVAAYMADRDGSDYSRTARSDC